MQRWSLIFKQCAYTVELKPHSLSTYVQASVVKFWPKLDALYFKWLLLFPHICPIHSRRYYITNEENINYNTGSPHANLLQRDYCSMIGMLKWLKATSLSILICASVPDEQFALCEAAYLDAPCHLNNNPFKYKESTAPLVSDHFFVGHWFSCFKIPKQQQLTRLHITLRSTCP